MKNIDPIEELHKIRQAICKKAGGTPADYFRYYLEMDREIVAAETAKKKTASSKPRKAYTSRKQSASARRAKASVRKAGSRG